MKKKLTILFLLVATLTVVLHNIIPHHHHGDKVCMVTELCDSECSSLDHQNHHTPEEEQECSKGCTLNNVYIVKSNNNQEDNNISTDYFIPICDILVSYLLFNNYPEIKEAAFPELNSFYKSSDYHSGLSLRAPPVA